MPRLDHGHEGCDVSHSNFWVWYGYRLVHLVRAACELVVIARRTPFVDLLTCLQEPMMIWYTTRPCANACRGSWVWRFVIRGAKMAAPAKTARLNAPVTQQKMRRCRSPA